MCLRLMATMYLDAIARMAAQPRNQRSFGDWIGVMINARMSAEM